GLGGVLGAVIGGLGIATIGLRPAFYLDAASFLVSAACIASIRVPRVACPTSESPSFLIQLAGGWEALRAHPIRRGVTTMAAVQVLGSGVSTVLAVVLAEKVLGGGAAGYGVLVSGMGGGALIGAGGATALGTAVAGEGRLR